MSTTPVGDAFDKAKAWYQSKTIIGVLIAAAGAILSALKPEWGLDLPGTANEIVEGAEEIADAADVTWGAILQAWGLVQAVWGRIVARFKIG